MSKLKIVDKLSVTLSIIGTIAISILGNNQHWRLFVFICYFISNGLMIFTFYKRKMNEYTLLQLVFFITSIIGIWRNT